MKHRTVFFLSDRTGITAETLGLSLISQFENIQFSHVTLPFLDSIEKAQETTIRIDQAFEADGAQPLVFATIVDPKIRAVLQQCKGHYVDFFSSFIPSLETALGTESTHVIGRIHGVHDMHAYNTRIDAVNFALNFDDGARLSGYESADVILVGVSRCGKTPTCLYLAMQFGIRAANYPLTEEELHSQHLPKALKAFKNKLFGLTIDAQRLQAIRKERKPDSRYATLEQCEHEVETVERLYKHEKIPFLSSTNLSIEELATKLMVIAKLQRRLR